MKRWSTRGMLNGAWLYLFRTLSWTFQAKRKCFLYRRYMTQFWQFKCYTASSSFEFFLQLFNLFNISSYNFMFISGILFLWKAKSIKHQVKTMKALSGTQMSLSFIGRAPGLIDIILRLMIPFRLKFNWTNCLLLLWSEAFEKNIIRKQF